MSPPRLIEKLCSSLLFLGFLRELVTFSMLRTGLSNYFNSISSRLFVPADFRAEIRLAGLLESIVWSLPGGTVLELLSFMS